MSIVPSEVAEIARRMLALEYPNGVANRVLRHNLKRQGASDKQISNGLYKLTSCGIAESNEGCYYLMNDPQKPAPVYAPLVKRAAVTVTPKTKPKAVTVPPKPKAKAVTFIKEKPLLSTEEKDALAFVNRIPDTIEDLLQPSPSESLAETLLLDAIRETGDLLKKARERVTVERVDFKTQVLKEIGAQFDDRRLDVFLAEIMDDLAAHAA